MSIKFSYFLFSFFIVLYACNNKSTVHPDMMAQTPEELSRKMPELLKNAISRINKDGRMEDSIKVYDGRLLNLLYNKNAFEPLWCDQENWLPRGDSLFSLIISSRLYGLFPEKYHETELQEIRKRFTNDSLAKGDRQNASLWAKADILLMDAFIGILHDVKLGRLPHDSITLRTDSVLSDEFYSRQLTSLLQSPVLTKLVEALEPKNRDYQLLKKAIPRFLDSADYREYTFVPDPVKDPAHFRLAIQKRLAEEGFLASDSLVADSIHLAEAIKNFQKKKNLNVDGRAGEGTIRVMNLNDRERFIRIAISLDKYKMLPEKMPDRYIWVNTSGNYLEVVDNDSVKIYSKTISGKTKTRTPLLNSNISELITYPQWVPPPSIITKEILPAVKKNPGYLARKGFSLLDSKGDEVDPFSVDWSKYNKSIPYRVVQGSGDANALGIMKFVFANKYSVYLHDTNQRYLFANSQRNLSHGCVRVQEWEKVALFILRNDSLRSNGNNFTKTDSLYRWLRNKQKRSIPVRNKIPVFIRYFTCDARDGRVIFYDDVYGEDKLLREKYYTWK